jgi:signal transduction histidine kinase
MRRRILLTILAITGLAIALFGLPLAIAVRSQETDEATLRLERQATLAARDIPDEFATAGADVAVLPSSPGNVSYALYTTEGELFAGQGPTAGDDPVLGAAVGRITDTEADGRLVVAVPVSADGAVVGVVRAEQPLSALDARVRNRWMAMGGLAVLALAMATVVGMRQARRLTRPVEDVRVAAQRLGNGDFTITVERSGIADLDDVADALTVTAGRLGRLVERERAFSADASHQLRTPLTGLRLTIETELADPRDDASAVLNEALVELDRLEATIEQLLTLARDSNGQRDPVDLPHLLGALEDRWHGPLARSGRPLRLSIEGDLPRPHVSDAAIGHVLDVLVDNACRHGDGEVTVEARPLAAGVAVTVTDQGPGIADPAPIFERRGPEAAGHGIGLALARSLAEAEGGRLVLERAAPSPQFLLLLPDS